MKYARGHKALGICSRSGRKMLLNDMVEDGETHLLVDPAWRDIYHPQKRIVNLEEGIGLKRPAPDLEQDAGGEGQSLAELLGFAYYFGGDRVVNPAAVTPTPTPTPTPTTGPGAFTLEDGYSLLLEDGTAFTVET